MDQEASIRDAPGDGRSRPHRLAGGAATAASAPTVTPRRPRVRDTIEVLPLADGSVYLLLPSGEQDMVIRDAPQEALALLRALDGTRTTADVEHVLGERFEDLDPRFVAESVAQLWEIGVVEDAAADADAGLAARELARYDRQLAYFAEVAPPKQPRAAYQRQLKDARVVVLGLGGLGSWTLYALASAGIGRIDGVDHDVVEPSNLNRQILYSPADVGTPKAEAAARRIAAYNPDVAFHPFQERIEAEADVARLVEGADFVVAAADWPPHEIEHWVNTACFELGVPYISASQFPPHVRIGPTYVPGVTGCFACAEERYRRESPEFDELVAARKGTSAVAATFAPGCALIGAVTSADVVHHLTGLAEPATLGSALVYDTRTMEMRREHVERLPGCPVCTAASERAAAA
jgi:molybdopterin-synthase adenylyltransferase